MARVALISLPFAGVDKPSIALCTLASGLRNAGHQADVFHLNLLFAEAIGSPLYFGFSNTLVRLPSGASIPYTSFAGEWLFASVFHDHSSQQIEDYLNQVFLAPPWSGPEELVPSLLDARSQVMPFIERCLQLTDWRQFDFIGFTSTFEQTFPSLLLARELRRRFPKMVIGLGGANCEGPMGEELLRQFPSLDVVCLGEGEAAMVHLAEALDRRAIPGPVPGFATRDPADPAQVVTTPAPPPIRLDDYPAPDFDSYFDQLYRSPLLYELSPWLQIETSRGCWWGQKSHCTFCGLNGATMNYRSKSPARVIRELMTITGRYHVPNIFWVDNILDQKYFKEVIPFLACGTPKLSHFVEVKSNLKPEQVRMLADAGFRRIQPGIESLSTPVLKLMNKGVTAIQNVLFLRLCRQFGIEPSWNLLFGFPGESPEHYVQQARLLPSLVHLAPPGASSTLRLDRFSPHFEQAEHFGYRNIRALKPYRHLFNAPAESLDRLAYYFDYEFADGRDPRAYTRDLTAFLRRWKDHPSPGTLVAVGSNDGGRIIDSRFTTRPATLDLEPAAWDFFWSFYQPRTFESAWEILRSKYPASASDPDRWQHDLEQLLADRLLMEEDGQYLALAVRQDREIPTMRAPRVTGGHQ